MTIHFTKKKSETRENNSLKCSVWQAKISLEQQHFYHSISTRGHTQENEFAWFYFWHMKAFLTTTQMIWIW